MKERTPLHHKPYIVCYDDYRCVSSLDKDETERLIMAGDVKWLVGNRQELCEFEIKIYQIYLKVKENMEVEGSPSNKDIVEIFNKDKSIQRCISRNAVARARRRIAHTMGFKQGW
jgi:TFIIF-interacting CTD phosphatase-like protein